MMLPFSKTIDFWFDTWGCMSSIKTNLSAMAALRTLGSVTQQLTSTEKRVSSGLKVASASDNATYWSVATTMRSDRGATSAVADALGVASATVDTAYAGMTSVLDTLSAFKAKLVTAKEGSVDKSKVQDELDQLKQQVASVATSASFNGVNMLSYSQAANLKTTNSVTTSVPAAFVRSADGTVSISDSDIDMTKTLLFNTGGGGLLQSDSDALGLATLGSFSGGSIGAVAGHQDFNFIGAQTFGASDAVSFDLTLDASDASAGNSYAITIDRSVVTAALGAAANGKIANGQDMAAVLNKAFQLAGAPASSGAEPRALKSPRGTQRALPAPASPPAIWYPVSVAGRAWAWRVRQRRRCKMSIRRSISVSEVALQFRKASRSLSVSQ